MCCLVLINGILHNIGHEPKKYYICLVYVFHMCVLSLFFRLVESSRSGRALTKSLPLHKHQLSPFAIYEENSIDGFVRGLTTQAVQSFDSSFTEEV